MSLSEIETTIEELAVRHPSLDATLLTTLLSSAGWEEKTIKEAVVLFAQKKMSKATFQQKEVTQSIVSLPALKEKQESVLAAVESEKKEETLTFIQPDGSEEGALNAFANEVITRDGSTKIIQQKIKEKEELQQEPKEPEKPFEVDIKESKKEEFKAMDTSVEIPKEILLTSQNSVEVSDAEIAHEGSLHQNVKVDILSKEPQSLIIHEEIPMKRDHEKKIEIPSNLPLLPFESSPHIWSFSKYKDMFHKEEIQVITVMPQKEKESIKVSKDSSQEKLTPQINEIDEEVTLNKVPLTKGDKSLISLAGMMLFVIILILGYMYSNGRL